MALFPQSVNVKAAARPGVAPLQVLNFGYLFSAARTSAQGDTDPSFAVLFVARVGFNNG